MFANVAIAALDVAYTLGFDVTLDTVHVFPADVDIANANPLPEVSHANRAIAPLAALAINASNCKVLPAHPPDRVGDLYMAARDVDVVLLNVLNDGVGLPIVLSTVGLFLVLQPDSDEQLSENSSVTVCELAMQPTEGINILSLRQFARDSPDI